MIITVKRGISKFQTCDDVINCSGRCIEPNRYGWSDRPDIRSVVSWIGQSGSVVPEYLAARSDIMSSVIELKLTTTLWASDSSSMPFPPAHFMLRTNGEVDRLGVIRNESLKVGLPDHSLPALPCWPAKA